MQTTATDTNTGTFAKGFIAFYLAESAEYHTHAQLLLAVYHKRKAGPVADALWNGYWLTKQKAENFIESLRERGGLLFFGQPNAVAAAQAMEDERRLVENAKLLGIELLGAAA